MRRYALATARILVVGFCTFCGCQVDDGPGMPVIRSYSRPDSSQITGDCLVTFYTNAGEVYFSRQSHVIVPSELTIRIKASEPGSPVEWRLSRSGYHTTVGNDGQSPASVIDETVVRAILACFVASTSLLDSAFVWNEPTKIDGQWYRSGELTQADNPAATITLLRNVNTGSVDRILIADRHRDDIVISESYNLHQITGGNRLAPQTIDILSAKSPQASRRRILKIEYLSLTTP